MEAKLFLFGICILAVALIMRKFRNRMRGDKWKKVYDEALEWLDTGFWAVIMASFIMYFFIQAFKIPSSSMASTLIVGDHLFVNKFIYGTRVPFTEKKILEWKDIKRGDIVVFRFPAADKNNPHYGKDFIKRAMGLPGDIIEIKDKKVYVNDELLKEDYTQHVDTRIYPGQVPYFNKTEYQQAWEEGRFVGVPHGYIRDNFGPVVIPESHYFVLGDNRDQSYDSRFWGPLEFKKTRGKALFLYWPLTRIKIIR